MKIDNSVKSLSGGAVKDTQSRGAKTGGTSAAPPSGGGSGVQLSPQLQQIQSGLAGGEVMDAARVQEIKAAISDGRFQINPDRIADKLIETAQDLIASQKK